MKPSPKLPLIALAVILACHSVQAEPTPAPTGEMVDIPVPEGVPVKGLRIPHRDETGKLVMTLEADVAKKIDEKNIAMENMRVEAFDDEGKKINVELKESTFNLDSRVLVGQKSARILREDFEITGDEIEFNTQTRNGVVRGNVKMTILSDNSQQ